MEPRHHCSHGNIEDLGRIGVRELADIDEDDRVTEVMWHFGERLNHHVLRKSLDDALLVGVLLGDRLFKLVVEEVVALFKRLRIGRALRLPSTIDVEVREDAQQPGPEMVPAWYCCQARNARA